MKNSHKGFALPLILAIIALLLAGGAYAYLQKNQTNQPVSGNVASQQATSTAQTSDSKIAGWKTYENQKYGFQMQYPANLEFDSYESSH